MGPFSLTSAFPAVNAGGDTILSTGDTLLLSGSGQDVFGGQIVKWEWDVGNTGSFVEVEGGNTAIVIPQTAGSEFQAVLRATDDDGNSIMDTLRITVSHGLPLPRAVSTLQEVSINDTIYLLGFNDGPDPVMKWEWDIGNTGTFSETSTGDTAILAPGAETLDFSCVLMVTNALGNTALDTVIIPVKQDPPSVLAGTDPGIAFFNEK